MNLFFARLDMSYIYAFLGEATLALTFIFYIALARVLGPEQYGIFAAAIALAGVLSLFIQFGFPALLGRNVAANPLTGAKSTLTFLLLEIVNSLAVLLFLFPITQILGFEGTGVLVCYLVVLSEVCRSAKLTLKRVLRGINEFSTETLSVSLERVCTYGLAGAVLFWTQSIVWVIVTIILVRLIDVLGLIYYISRKTQIFSSLNWQDCWQSWRIAYPFAVSGVLWILYYQLDMLTLQWLAPSIETGLYGASYRIIEIFSALPRVIFYVTFTKFASYHATQPEKLPGEIYKSTRLLIAGVLPIIIIAGLCVDPLVSILYGESFELAVNSLSILIPSLGIKLFGSLVQRFLESTGRERLLPPLLLGTVIVNIVTNIILIPYLGAVGAAIATVLSEIILALVGLFLIARLGYQDIGWRLQKIACLSLLAASIPSLIRVGLPPLAGAVLILVSLLSIAMLMRQKAFLATSG
ncbi:MAG: oligosaccharide flippase family protein [Leptolyngbyaceae cyanobacterium]